jgi:hypothetical protein
MTDLHCRLHFGKHKGRRVCDVDDDYLVWALLNADCLTAPLRSAIVAELRSRGVASYRWDPRFSQRARQLRDTGLDPPPPRCHRCGGYGMWYYWAELPTGDRQILRRCAACGQPLGLVPPLQHYVALADEAEQAHGHRRPGSLGRPVSWRAPGSRLEVRQLGQSAAPVTGDADVGHDLVFKATRLVG